MQHIWLKSSGKYVTLKVQFTAKNFIKCSYQNSSNILPVIFLFVYLLFGKSILNKVRFFEQEILFDKSLRKEAIQILFSQEMLFLHERKCTP